MGVGIVGCHGRKSNDIQSNSDLNIYTQKNQIMKLASKSYSVLVLMVVVVSVLFGVTVANPLPQSEDDYGDFDVSKLDRQGKLEDDTADADLVEGADPIGDIFGDLLKGAGALLTEGIKIVTDVTDGSKNVTETLGDVLKVGTDATEEVAKIGVKAIGAAPSILEQKIAFAQGFGKTVEETSGQVKQVVTVLPDLLPNSRQIDAAAKLAQ